MQPLNPSLSSPDSFVSLQELQYENASLKAKLAELYAAQKCDKEAFDRKLG